MLKFELDRSEKIKRRVSRKAALPGKQRARRTFAPILALSAIGITAAMAQTSGQLDRDAVLGHLNSAISWYRNAASKLQTVGLPSDAIYQDNAQNLAAEAVRLAFESARAEARLISAAGKSAATNEAQPSGAQPSGAQPSGSQSPAGAAQPEKFSQMLARLAAQIADAQKRIDALDKQIASARGSKKDNLISQRQNLQGAIELDKAMEEDVQKMATFAENNYETSAKGLEGSINDLARSIPEISGISSAQAPATKPVTAQVGQPQARTGTSEGLVGEAIGVYWEMRSIHEIDKRVSETAQLRAQVTELQKPLRANLIAIVHRGRDLANLPNASGTPQQAQPPAPATPGAAPQAPTSPKEYQAITNNFKQLSSALLPLSQEIVVLDESRSNFLEWRRSVVNESGGAVRSLLTRVVILALALGLVFALSDVWRRLTFRYIRDPRRRHQFLIMRRFVIGFLIGVVLILGFVSEFSSLATFAGFVTAGIAVGLQGVLLSVAAYFFVVGRHGISVGDRISIAGVTGDVVDIGLVRIHLIEMAGTGIELYPTGRLVVFANSVLFQAGTPLYKQIPGADYSWHEVVVALAPEANLKLVQEKVLGAVNAVYAQYRAAIERQYSEIERAVEIQLQMPSPEGRLQFAGVGLEFTVRYPVEIRRAAEIDDKVTEKLLEALAGEPNLKAAVSGVPKIRAAVKG
jgi:small-conductance mechanosensitive channel